MAPSISVNPVDLTIAPTTDFAVDAVLGVLAAIGFFSLCTPSSGK